MRIHILNTLVFCFIFQVDIAYTQQIIRGPYLQLGTPNSMVIRWRTDMAISSEILFGTDSTALGQSAQDTGSKTEHELQLTGLQPSTFYYYQISGVTNGTSRYQYFKTSLPANDSGPVRIWAIGDFGNGSQDQRDVQTAYLNQTGNTHTDVWLWLGDNAYNDGTDQQYQNNLFDIYNGQLSNTVSWPCPGNHDYGSIDVFNNGPYYDIITVPTNGDAGGEPSGTEGYYSFDYGNVHFISLNSEYLLWIAISNTDMIDWLEDDLQQNSKEWTIAFWHQPPYSRGSHDSDELLSRMSMMRSNVNPVLEEYGVDLVLTGHSHSYERSYLLKGHYCNSNTFDPSTMVLDEESPFIKYTDGTKPNEGTVYTVVGCSGKLGGGTIDHPAMLFSTTDHYGSMAIDIDGNVLSAQFINSVGQIIDEFSIVKQPANATNINEANQEIYGMNIFTNPSNGNIHCVFDLAEKTRIKLSLHNINGKRVKTMAKGNYSPGEQTVQFDTTKLETGVYFVRLELNSQVIAQPLVVN